MGQKETLDLNESLKLNVSLQLNASLHYAAKEGRAVVLKKLLEDGADPDSVDVDDNSALHISINKGNLSCTKMLLDAGANVDRPGQYGFTPLILAVSKGNDAILNAVMERGPDINKTDIHGNTAAHHLRWSEKNSALDFLDQLLAMGFDANINLTNNLGQSLLFDAVCFGSTEQIQGVIDRGANIALIDADGEGLIFSATQKPEKLAFLLERGADPNARNLKWETPLHQCAQIFCMKLLIDAGADVNALDRDLRSPLLCAMTEVKEYKNKTFLLFPPPGLASVKDFVSTMIIAGADPDLIDINGNNSRGIINMLCEEASTRGAEARATLLPLLQAYDARAAMQKVLTRQLAAKQAPE